MASSRSARSVGDQFDHVVLSRYPTMSYPHRRRGYGGRWKSRRRYTLGPPPRFRCLDRRVDLRHLPVYTVDPAGSDDADDGFSIEVSADGSMRLYVHVCDPTALFDPWDQTFLSAVENGTSFYPSGRRSRRMFSRALASEASLTNGERFAVTAAFVFSSRRRLMDCELCMSRVVCSPELRFDHRAAARRLAYDQDFARCEELALLLPEQLKGQVHFTRMDYLRLAYPRVSGPDDRVELVTDPPGTVRAKEMVAFMAVATNGLVAHLLEQHLGGTALTEHFVARKHLPYVQFTSPLRRLRDCVVHFEIKNLLLADPSGRLSRSAPPRRAPTTVFSDEEAERLHRSTERTSRKRRDLQQINVKFRFLQYIHQRLQEVDRVRLRLCPHRLASTSASLFVDGIDEHRTHFLYHVYRPEGGIRPRGIRLRRMFDRRDKQEEDDGNGAGSEADRCLEVDITRCHLSDNPYHNQTLPEVDAMFDSGIKKPTRSQSAP